jgi:putative ABC transport system ATP-binding protein
VQHFPNQLSGGEKQRVAIARAMVNNPKILFADEPTGNLDKSSSTAVSELLFSVNQSMDTTLIIVTHDLTLADQCNTLHELAEGELIC